jgi:hypothetical protein
MVHIMHCTDTKFMYTCMHACMLVQGPLIQHAIQLIIERSGLHTDRDQIYATKQRLFIYRTYEKYTSWKQ